MKKLVKKPKPIMKIKYYICEVSYLISRPEITLVIVIANANY